MLLGIIVILILVIIILCSGIHWYHHYKASRLSLKPLADKPSPVTTVFAFDLNQVVVMADGQQIGKIIWYELPKLKIVGFFLAPWHWPFIIKTAIKERHPEFFFDAVYKQYPSYAPLEHLYVKMMSQQKLNKGTVEIIQHLTQNGYSCYLLSNIGPKAFGAIEQKIPLIKSLFTGTFIESSQLKNMSKPHKKFYRAFEEYLHLQRRNPTQIIFVDNDATNILAADTQGFHGILFTTADTLAKQLIQLHILYK